MTAQQGTATHLMVLGSIESTAPSAALVSALLALRPQWNIRLVPIESPAAPRYRVEIEQDTLHLEGGHIDAWLHIKSALMATFPADKPHAVKAFDP